MTPPGLDEQWLISLAHGQDEIDFMVNDFKELDKNIFLKKDFSFYEPNNKNFPAIKILKNFGLKKVNSKMYR